MSLDAGPHFAQSLTGIIIRSCCYWLVVHKVHEEEMRLKYVQDVFNLQKSLDLRTSYLGSENQTFITTLRSGYQFTVNIYIHHN